MIVRAVQSTSAVTRMNLGGRASPKELGVAAASSSNSSHKSDLALPGGPTSATALLLPTARRERRRTASSITNLMRPSDVSGTSSTDAWAVVAWVAVGAGGWSEGGNAESEF